MNKSEIMVLVIYGVLMTFVGTSYMKDDNVSLIISSTAIVIYALYNACIFHFHINDKED